MAAPLPSPLLASAAQTAPAEPGGFTLGPISLNPTMLSIVTRVGGALLAILIALALLRLVPVLERFVIRRATRNAPATNEEAVEGRQRVETLVRVTGGIARALIWGMTIIVVLGNFGIAVAPLLAGAGIAGVAIGFGAQSIVKDFFAGFFILLENQFGVGDTVTIAGVTGTVEQMTLRVTMLRDATGTAHFIPNSNIANVANRTYGWGRAAIDVAFATSVHDDEARAALEAAAARASSAPGMTEALVEPVAVEGPVEFTGAATTWRLVGKAHAHQFAEVKRAMISALRAELAARGLAQKDGALAKVSA